MTLTTPFYTQAIGIAIHIFKIIAIFIGGYYVSKFVNKKLKIYLSSIYSEQLVINLISRTTSYAILFVAFTAIAHELGADISILLTAAGVFGIAIGLAAKTSFSNIISGFFLVLERPFKHNDFIVIDKIEGRVQEINLFSVTLYTNDNRVIRIPHEKILKSVTINNSQMQTRRYETTIPLAVNQDCSNIIAITKEVIKNNQYAMTSPEPLVYIQKIEHGMYQPYVKLFIGAWSLSKDLLHVKKTFIPELKTAFDTNDIKII